MNDPSVNITASETVDPDELSDHEDTALNPGSRGNAKSKEIWNVFRDPPPKLVPDSTTYQQCMEVLVKIIKVFICLLIFILILANTVCTKVALFFLTSQLKEGRTTLYCNQSIDPEKTFAVTLPEEERIAWLWCLIFLFWVPEIKNLLASLALCCGKPLKRPKIGQFMFLMFMETLHTAGVAMMFIVILPEMDVVQGSMLTCCMCFVPGFLGLLSRSKNGSGAKRAALILVDLAALAAQGAAFVLWPLLDISNRNLWFTPISLFLISCGWWENYVSLQSPFFVIRSLCRIKDELRPTKPYIYLYLSNWKMIAFLCFSAVILHFKGTNAAHLFTMLGTTFGNREITVYEVQSIIDGETMANLSAVITDGVTETIISDSTAWVTLFEIQFTTAGFVYLFGLLSSKMWIQRIGFALPVTLTVPATIWILIIICDLRDRDPCYFHDTIIPDHTFFVSPTASTFGEFISEKYAWVWLLWLFSQTWITIHIWTPKSKRFALMEHIFVLTINEAMFPDQSMALTRRRDDQPEATAEKPTDVERETEESEVETVFQQTDSPPTQLPIIKKKDRVTNIFACATMWHETREEMLDFLKSILRLDQDQCARKNAQDFLKIVDPDYYEFETHIFFDDAFEISDHDHPGSQVNRFVKLFIEILDEAASDIHHTQMYVKAPKKCATPYGGRLVWTLPGNTKMIAHLKDKSKIRHRKRWSQVMYMYYLLGHRIMDLPIGIPRKEVIAENTYLLNLDGDIDFQPSAVKCLVDAMKKKANLGAACGRIHPVGTGLIFGYQKFEYAIGHWFQKTTEHVLGSTLYSPGCFSLFKAKALMDDSVMRKYTTNPNDAKQYVQYEQSEDRWLSILLLQRGYKIHYSVASHVSTHTPNNFKEFFNQRRRWIPATIANLMDLIINYKRTVKKNKNISFSYIVYLFLFMVMTILGPGIVLLVLIESLVFIFDIALWTSFYLNIIPVLLFIVVCFTCKPNAQLRVAALMSIMYMLAMVVVMTTFFITTAQNGWLAPSSVIFFLIIGLLVTAALMHPRELFCLLGGFVYYLAIPSTYILLVIYSVTNLHDLKLGTREVSGKKTLAELLEGKTEAEKAKVAAEKTMLGTGPRNDNKNVETSIEFTSSLFNCTLYNHGKTFKNKQQMMAIADSFDHMMKPWKDTVDTRKSHPVQDSASVDEPADSDTQTSVTSIRDVGYEREIFSVSPNWFQDEDFKELEAESLSIKEEHFWKGLIDDYLAPVEKYTAEKEQIANDLKELRNESSGVFLMLNALVILTVFFMQLSKDTLSIRWPPGSTSTNVTYDTDFSDVQVTEEYFQLEPIGFVFIIFFIPIFALQYIVMFIHRFDKFYEIVSLTNLLNWRYCKPPEDILDDSILQNKDAIAIVNDLQRVGDDDDDDDNDDDDSDNENVTPGHRKMVRKLEMSLLSTTPSNCSNLDEIFRARFLSNGKLELSRKPPVKISSNALKAFEARRAIVLEEIKKLEVETERRSQISIERGDKNDNQGGRILGFEVDGHVTQDSSYADSKL